MWKGTKGVYHGINSNLKFKKDHPYYDNIVNLVELIIILKNHNTPKLVVRERVL